MRALSHWRGCEWFWVWAFVGAVLALGFVSLGPLLTIPAFVAAGLILSRHGAGGAFGVLTGIGGPLLVIAYIQRSGQSYDPLHWLVAGLVFCTAGVIGHAWRTG